MKFIFRAEPEQMTDTFSDQLDAPLPPSHLAVTGEADSLCVTVAGDVMSTGVQRERYLHGSSCKAGEQATVDDRHVPSSIVAPLPPSERPAFSPIEDSHEMRQESAPALSYTGKVSDASVETPVDKQEGSSVFYAENVWGPPRQNLTTCARLTLSFRSVQLGVSW
jgi:hypothetical protein